MSQSELAQLEVQAELDLLVESLRRWATGGPCWQPAARPRGLVQRLLERTGAIRLRMEAPLVVATLGGTGTGKSALVNALAGADLTRAGRQRPTTLRPAIICRPDIAPQQLGIDPDAVDVIPCQAANLANLVLIDCPDPDTSESPHAPASNLARLRRILPHCDVLLITTTQQKYRSGRVADELAAAAIGARLIFVQTHADVDQDIRDDWRSLLEARYQPGRIFLLDSLAALADAEQAIAPRGEFADLVDLLTRQLAGTAPGRIRRANLLELVEQTLTVSADQLDEAMPKVRETLQAIDHRRTELGRKLAAQMHTELLAGRRQWEIRLVGRVAARWGLSPFSLVLRAYQAAGGLLSGALLLRARSPAQVALWGAWEGTRHWRKARRRQRAHQGTDRALAQGWNRQELHEAALVLDGYAAEAGLDRHATSTETVLAEAAHAGEVFAAGAAAQLDALVERVAARYSGWLTRGWYESLTFAMLVLVLFRPAKNFFYDCWLAHPVQPPLGIDFYLVSAFWMALWCVFLLWGFTGRLRRGLRREIRRLSNTWQTAQPAEGLFAGLESECRQAIEYRAQLHALQQQVARLRRQLNLPHAELGSRR